MGLSDFWLQFNNGKKEQLGDTKSGIRKEQVDKKFHNLFDAYDTNQSEVLESNELEGIFKTLSSYAGNDKILNNTENQLIASIFGANTNVKDIDFQGFVKSVSSASADIIESKETQLEDGGKEIVTEYADGTKETIGYYSNGEFKYKKTEKILSETHYYVEINGQKQEVDKQNYELALKRMEEMLAQQKKPRMIDGCLFNLPSLIPDVKISSQTEERPDIQYDFSGRAYLDIQARDFLLTHFIETHYGTQEALDTMGILDDIGAAINTGAGELWNACVNIYNKHFGNGTEEDYKNFYELIKKFEPQYDRAVLMKSQAKNMQEMPELYFKNFETDFKNKTGNKYNLQEVIKFQQLAEQYQTASVLTMRMDCLKKALNEVRMYQSTQDALTYNPAQSEGMNPAQHLLNAQKYLLQYFDNDKEAADLILNGTIGNADKTLETINSLLSDTELQLKDALNKKEISLTEDNEDLKINADSIVSYANFEELKAEYQNSYKAMYGTDFVPDELTDKVMSAKATGGFVKIAAITIVSILITKSPVMANIMRASAGAVVDGASANFIRGLVSKYGQTVVQQGIKFAMSTGTLATDVGLTLLNQVTDNREGINGEEVWETTKGAAKYIYFGAFVGSPLAQAVTQKVGKLGIAGKLFVNGTKTTQGAITTTTITGEQLVQNFMKASNSIVAKGAGFATDIAAFTLLDITTEDIAPGEALESQAEMLTGLKIMHKAFEYMLGGRTHTAIQKANWEAAIEKSGVKNWNIKEIKTPTADGKGFKVVYDVDFNGIPLGKMNDANALITAMMGKVSETYHAMETENSSKPKTETVKREEVIIQEICDKYKDLSDKDLQAEIIRETALGNDEKVSELTIAFTQRGHKVSFADSEGKVVIEKVDNKIETKFEETRPEQKGLLEGGVKAEELTEIAPFARRLVENEQILIAEKEIKRIEQNLIDRMVNKTSEEERVQIQDIINKVTPDNIGMINSMLSDDNTSNETILNILNSCNKPYKISIPGLFNPINIPIFLLQHTGFIGDIKLNDKLKRNYAHKLILDNNVPNETIPGILQNMDKGNVELIETALKTKDFNFNLLPAILKNTLIESGYYVNNQKCVKSSRVKFAEKLINNSNIPNDCIPDILYHYGMENVNNKFVENLCSNKDFPPQEISTLIGNISHSRKGTCYLFNTSEPKFKQKLAERLVVDKNCPNEYIADIIGAIEKSQEKLFNEIYTDVNIPKSEISSILWLDYALKKGYDKLDFADKIAFLTNSVAINDATLAYLSKFNIDKVKIESLVDRISMEMGLKKENIPTTNENRKVMFKNYIANNSMVESCLSDIDLGKYSKGIPLKYERAQFIKDIENILIDISVEDKSLILNSFNFTIENGKMEGFPIISNKTVNIKEELLPIMDKIKERIVAFTQRNEVNIDNIELKQILDSIIQGCPEFITIIGKAQHETHRFSVDVHTLKVLQNAFKNPEYNKLDNESKTVLKFAILLHDIGKKEGVRDNIHYETSAKYAVSILDRYNLPARVKSRIIETIYNHHWFEQYNKNEVSANLVNAMYRTPKDLQVATIMAKADLSGVSDNFHLRITKTHNENAFNDYFDRKVEELYIQQDARYKNINLVIDTKFQQTDSRKFPTMRITVDGKDYNVPVLNLTDETMPNDLYEFGFTKGTTRKNARFFSHFNDRIKGLKVFMALSSSPTTESVQSLSMISLENSRAYKNQTYGVITDVDMANIAQASNTNIASGYKKNMKTFAKDLYSFWQINTYVRDNFFNELINAGISLSKEEYVQLSKELVNIQYSSQVTKDIKIGDKILPANLVQQALDSSRDKLFEGDVHSEIVAINPRVKALVARVSSIEECSKEFLELAVENDLPIILIGHNE